MEWNTSYSVGNEILDQQHQELFEKINLAEKLFRDYFEKGIDISEALHLVQGLKAYAIEHFETEEAYMKKINYPHLLEHQKKHQSYIEHIEKIDEKRIHHSTEEVVLEIFSFLNLWIVEHIHSCDKDYQRFIEENHL